MTESESLEVLRIEFCHVNVQRIEVVTDDDGERVARIYIPEDDLTEALGEDGINARRAAKLSGINIEVLLATI